MALIGKSDIFNMKERNLLIVVYVVAAFVRILIANSSWTKDISERVEISTPVNSFYRVIESQYRQELGIDPYSSDIVHEPPLHLYIYQILMNIFGDYIVIFFIACDVITAHCLYMAAKEYMFEFYVNQARNKYMYNKDVPALLMYGKDFFIAPFCAACMYLFNPYSIFSCIAQTTTAFGNVFLAIFFVSLIYKIPILGVFSLVMCTTQSLYPIVLLSPLFLSIKKAYDKIHAAAYMLIFVAVLAVYFLACHLLYGSFDFLQHTYGFILTVKDQQPNVGVFWYFFMEMFEHFRLLFIYSYQMNVTILYFVPLSIKFRKDPILLAACFTFLTAIFKSYPSVGDFAFTIAILPFWSYLFHCMQQIFISGVTILITTALAPILWDLWIMWGTANANFYFGTTLAFITAHIFLLTDISFGITKYDYMITFGNERNIDGKEGRLVLE